MACEVASHSTGGPPAGVGHITKHHPHGAEKVRDRLRSAMSVLAAHPFAGRITARPQVRRIVAVPYPYAITYIVADGEIVILGIRHTARRPLE